MKVFKDAAWFWVVLYTSLLFGSLLVGAGEASAQAATPSAGLAQAVRATDGGTAENIVFDPANTELTSTTVQAALAEASRETRLFVLAGKSPNDGSVTTSPKNVSGCLDTYYEAQQGADYFGSPKDCDAEGGDVLIGGDFRITSLTAEGYSTVAAQEPKESCAVCITLDDGSTCAGAVASMPNVADTQLQASKHTVAYDLALTAQQSFGVAVYVGAVDPDTSDASALNCVYGRSKFFVRVHGYYEN